MEQQFIALWLENRARAAKLGVRMRPITAENALRDAHRCLTGNRESDGFSVLADKNRLDLTLEALEQSHLIEVIPEAVPKSEEFALVS